MVTVGATLAAIVLIPVIAYGVYWFLQPVFAVQKRAAQEDSYVDENGDKKSFPSINEPASLHLSIIVPAYNEEDRMPEMFNSTMKYLQDRQAVDKSLTFEIIIVDDGSKDGTPRMVREYTRQYTSDTVRLLRLGGNNGKGGAVRKGMMRSRGKYLLMADADGASLISDLEKLERDMQKIEKNNLGITVGSRNHLVDDAIARRSVFRNFLMHGFHMLVSTLCVKKIRDTQCGFKLFSRKAAAMTFPNQHIDNWAFDVEILFLAQQQDIPIAEVPINWTEIPGSKLSVLSSSINMARDLVLIRGLYTLGIWKMRKLM